MPNAKFGLGSVNITDYLIVLCKLASDPGPELSRQVFGPNPSNVNVTFLNLNSDTYIFEVYESPDGVALAQFFERFEIDVPTNTILEEWRPYNVGGSNSYDPPANTDATPSTTITDPYLDGKNVVSFQQRGTSALRENIEWQRTTTGIALLGGLFFNDQDVYFAVINYRVSGSSTGNTPTQTEVNIVANTVLDSSYYNKIINLNGTGTKLVVTLDSVANIPDGTEFIFIDEEGGTQRQTKIVPQTGEFIMWNGLNMPETWVGKGEYLKIKKRGTKYKIITAPDGMNKVGTRFSGIYNNHINAHPEDNSLWSADDYPRIWWFIVNLLPANSKIIDDNVTDAGYVRPVNRQGQFVISTTKRQFRFPMTAGLSEKGLKDFNTYANNTDRTGTDPGYFQGQKFPNHRHIMHENGLIKTPGQPDLNLSTENTGPYAHSWSGGGTAGFGGQVGPDPKLQTGFPVLDANGTIDNTATSNIVDNFGVVFMICI